MENQKMRHKAWLILIAIFAFPIAIALIIVAAVQVLQPYAKGCAYNGKTLTHLETFIADCNTCTCNDGAVSCTEIDCNQFPVQNEDDALEMIKEISPEFESYPDTFGRNGSRKSTLMEKSFNYDRNNWYIAFIEEDKNGMIISGTCYNIDENSDIGLIGEVEEEIENIDIKTCKELVSEYLVDQNVFTEENVLQSDYEPVLVDLNENFFYDIPFPESVAKYNSDDLINIKCSDWYYKSFEKQEFYTEESVLISSTSTLYNLIDKFDTEKTITQASLCEAEDGRLLFRKIEEGGGGGLNNKSSFIWMSNSEDILSEGTIDNTDIGAPYFLCKEALYISDKEDTILYHICAAGDGGYGMRSIYEVNLNHDEEPKLIYKCESMLPVYDPTPENMTVTCESY